MGVGIWRTPHAAKPDGRDHHETAFTVWMAGGGIKGGVVYRATDEVGMRSVENITEVHDLKRPSCTRSGSTTKSSPTGSAGGM